MIVELASTGKRGPIFPSEKSISEYVDGDCSVELKREDNPALSETDRKNVNDLIYALLKRNPDARLSLEKFQSGLDVLMSERRGETESCGVKKDAVDGEGFEYNAEGIDARK